MPSPTHGSSSADAHAALSDAPAGNHTVAMARSADDPAPQAANLPQPRGRSSFCSVREREDEVAQTFTTSTDSAATAAAAAAAAATADAEASRGDETAVISNGPRKTKPDPSGTRPLKSQKISGRSFSVANVFTRERLFLPPMRSAPIERLPREVHDMIIVQLTAELPTHGIRSHNADMISLLRTSRAMYEATVVILYRHVIIPHALTFRKFLNSLQANPLLGEHVRRLDFAHFNPTSIYTTAKERAAAVNLTPQTLKQCLALCPGLMEFMAQEYLEGDIDMPVLRMILAHPRTSVVAADFCGIYSEEFRVACSGLACDENWPKTLKVQRLSFHKCCNVPPLLFEKLLRGAKELSHFDAAGTRMTDLALSKIRRDTRLTHLNLSKCKQLSSQVVVDFISRHPAARKLVFLSLATESGSRHSLQPNQVTVLLKSLPGSLRSLNLLGSRMVQDHIEPLRNVIQHLEELALGSGLSMEDVNRIFFPGDSRRDDDEDMGLEAWSQTDYDDEESGEEDGEDIDMEEEESGEDLGTESDGDAGENIPHTLRYLDISNITLRQRDIGFLFSRRCSLLTKRSTPLEIIEVLAAPIAANAPKESIKSAASFVGWKLKELQQRSWIVREDAPVCPREWKWGATLWGMRKLPVARTQVGGMYGSFMYARKL